MTSDELGGTTMVHGGFGFFAKSVLVADESDDHAVQVEEEHQEVETKLDEGFLHTTKPRVSNP
jgi:hypothetical protein